LDELPASVERERLRPTSWSDYGTPREIAPRQDLPALSTGDSVKHETLGEGVVLAVEPGGVAMVRFTDGSERRLMLDYAPLQKI
jgi:ATP-dependent DNA helicase UvrD/PcrA